MQRLIPKKGFPLGDAVPKGLKGGLRKGISAGSLFDETLHICYDKGRYGRYLPFCWDEFPALIRFID